MQAEIKTGYVKAIVQKIFSEGKHGPFAVATSETLGGSITFSLEPTVWTNQSWPEEGTVVHLSQIRQKRAGWRAKVGRFWMPSDEKRAKSKEPQFLYPVSRQFPFDSVCDQIVRELEKRNWQVPGIEVDFYEYGSGEMQIRRVRSVKGPDFRLIFGRVQGRMSDGYYNDTAGVNELAMPQQIIRVYDDESGPTFYLYVGDDWKRDREDFMNGSKVISKLHNKPRMYLLYKGSCNCQANTRLMDPLKTLGIGQHTHPGFRAPILIHDNDWNREYDPEENEPRFFYTADVMDQFVRYLESTILAMILACPIPTEKIDRFAPPAPIPVPESIKNLFCFGDRCDAKRINIGREDKDRLPAYERYGMEGSGMRLLSLGHNNQSMPKIAYDGFLWCGVGEVTAETDIGSLVVPGHYHGSGFGQFVIRVTLNRANGVYIADHGQYEKRRQEIGETLGERDRFTDEEVADFNYARARTIMPITEYQGGFDNPIILINRELSFDEVEVVGEVIQRPIA